MECVFLCLLVCVRERNRVSNIERKYTKPIKPIWDHIDIYISINTDCARRHQNVARDLWFNAYWMNSIMNENIINENVICNTMCYYSVFGRSFSTWHGTRKKWDLVWSPQRWCKHHKFHIIFHSSRSWRHIKY